MWSRSQRCKGCDFQIRLNRCGGERCHPRDSLVQLEQRQALTWFGAISAALWPGGSKSKRMTGRLTPPAQQWSALSPSAQ